MTHFSAAPPEAINLLRGWPAPSLLPIQLLQTATQTALSDPATAHAGLNYGPDAGHEPLRAALGEWLSAFYAPSSGPVTAPRIAITGGASQNLAVLLSAFTDPSFTRAAWLVAPAYFLAFGIFADAGIAVRGVREDDQGLDLGFLESRLARAEEEWKTRLSRTGERDRPRWKRGKGRKIYRHVIYCVPSFANPSGKTMSLSRREGLIRLARRFDALVVCDDVYDFLQWRVDGSTQGTECAGSPRVVDVDRFLDGGAEGREGADGYGNVVSNGSFSKIVGPGLRVGWCEGTEKLAFAVSQVGATRSGGAPSQLTSTYVTSLLTLGTLSDHLKSTLRPAYAKRYAALRSAIEIHLVQPLNFTLSAPTSPSEGNDDGSGDRAGGFFLWLGLPSSLVKGDGRRGGGGAVELARRCADVGVVIAPGGMFEIPVVREDEGKEGGVGFGGKDGVGEAEEEESFNGFFRLCFAYEDIEKMVEGIKRVAAVATEMVADVHKGKRESDEGSYVLVHRSDDQVMVDMHK